MSLKPLADNLFREADGGIRLVGGRCSGCDAVTFPLRSTCNQCDGGEVREELLPRRGTVWTWTTQSFLPKAPYIGNETDADFPGYVVGYVDLPGACLVETRIDVPAGQAGELAPIGTEVESVAIEFPVQPDGEVFHTYAFRPVDAAGANR
ncbi:MAG: uncharacterized protein QOE74_6354 [Mycobacterium sp.]|nr:uncharacterized protein [Mycobacterium sp.]